jgi:NSS family neurotransmitter:Na+ symporter
MQIRESSFGYWSSPRAFLLVATGAALGIGNSARLPYLMSEYGGVVFLGAYVLFLLIVGLPLLVAEWSMGRWMRDELGAGFQRLAQLARAARFWKWLGRLAVAGAVMILSYYSVIAGWSLGFLFRGAAGVLATGEVEEARRTFLSIASDPERSLAWHTLFMVTTTVIVSYGFRDGIERAARLLVPAVAACSAVFLLLALLEGDPVTASLHIFTPDFSRFGWRGAVEALYQAFFTLGLGLGAMMTLGAYLPVSVPLVRMGLVVLLGDTVFGMIMGVALMSLMAGAGIVPGGGLVLLFQSLPQAISSDVLGSLLAVLFYATLFLVTLMAATTLLEPVTRFLMERYRQTRVFAAVGAATLAWSLGIGSLLSFGMTADLKLFGQNFFEWMQLVTSFILIPVVGILVCFFIARVLPRDLSRALWGQREPALFPAWIFALRFPARLGLVIILLHGLGLLDRFAALWS